jgi:hypothetical protein
MPKVKNNPPDQKTNSWFKLPKPKKIYNTIIIKENIAPMANPEQPAQ